MKQTFILLAFIFALMSCNNSSTTTNRTDSTSTNQGSATTDTLNTGTGATGTTGTGTVSDSGNAAAPGSDTTYLHPNSDSAHK